jgi:predicted Zn-dependent protease
MIRRLIAGSTLLAVLSAAAPATMAQAPVADDKEGVKVGSPSFVRKLVPAETLENAALQQYSALKKEAGSKNALLPPNDPQNVRLRRIARDLLPHAHKWNPRAKDWKWEVVLVRSGNINAFCMPGGKIAFFTGILDKLKLTDDEVALVMGHEIAHALREHARERAAKTTLTNAGGRIIGALIFGGGAGELIGAAGGNLLTLRFSRNDELESDLIGMELAARAGYDPAAGVTLWEKMSAASKGAPPQWLSTHPAGETRIKTIKDNLKDVQALYERAKAAKAAGGPMPPAFPGADQSEPSLQGQKR